jgi:predicted O-methyltransferase YrrM
VSAELGEELLELARRTPGFLPEAEGLALHRAGLEALPRGPLLEVGSYCGLSALYLGAAARSRGGVLFSLDHHHGSEEHQPGEEYHQPALVGADGRVDTLPCFRRTIAAAHLEDWVIGVIGASAPVAAAWGTPLGLVFIDGGHSQAAADADYAGWARHVVPGGLLAIHDVFPDPAAGGRPPFVIYERALADGWREIAATGSLRVLRRPAPAGSPRPPRRA